MLHNGGQNQQWPTSGPSGHTNAAVQGVPDASERETKPQVAHKCPTSGPSGYINLEITGVPRGFRALDKTSSGAQLCVVAT